MLELFIVLALVLSIIIHEYAHALVADYWGDPTPRRFGRLTLNPLAHVDPLGFVALLLFRIGWAKPVPIDYYYLRARGRLALLTTILAGPISNIILGVVIILAGVMIHSLFGGVALIYFLYPAVYSIFLAFFNLLPFSPLDGWRIVELYLCGRLPVQLCDAWEQVSPYLLLMFVFMGQMTFVYTLSVNIVSWFLKLLV